MSWPGLNLFWTAYDPLDLASGSVDLLGLQRGYVAIADQLLPGMTTLTTWPRYASMLCAAIAQAQKSVPDHGARIDHLRAARLQAIKSYERAWALACVLAVEHNERNKKTIEGLRGVQSVRRRLDSLTGREKYIQTRSYNLLADQARYGGLGAYSTFLEHCRLASMRRCELQPLGEQLGEAFPAPTDSMPVYKEDANLDIEGLCDWGRRCRLEAIGNAEARVMVKALRGDNDQGPEAEIRWTMLRLLAPFTERSSSSEQILLRRLQRQIGKGRSARSDLDPRVLRQIGAALCLLIPYETCRQAMTFIFDFMRAAATDEPVVKLPALYRRSQIREACEALRQEASTLQRARDQAADIDQKTVEQISKVWDDAGVSSFFASVDNGSRRADVLRAVLERHQTVQSGKFDGTLTKSPFLQLRADQLQLTAQRHGVQPTDLQASWQKVPWHSYRTAGAFRFIEQCRIS